MGCHSKDVTRIVVDTNSETGTTIKVDGQCYINTGNTAAVTQLLHTPPLSGTSCSDCEDE